MAKRSSQPRQETRWANDGVGVLQGGPQSVEDYGKLWSSLSKVFPNAEIVASTFDNYTEVLAAKRDALPRVSKQR